MKRLTEFESLDDFGYTTSITDSGKVTFIKCDSDFKKLSDSESSTLVYTNSDLTTGVFFTLDEILSGGSLSVTIDDSISGDQAELALDYSLATTLAFLGSVYSTVQIGINKIKNEYPNGFMIYSAITGTNTIMFDNANTYMYGSDPFSILDYTGFELVQAYSGVYQTAFTINAQTSVTGGTYSLLFLGGQPDLGTDYDHTVQPSDNGLAKFYSTLTPYELDLLVPPIDRTNYFPRDPIATNNVIFEGSTYDAFIETESDWGTAADNEDSNFIWRKLYPDGQKNLDSDDAIMQRMVLTFAMSFDKIKQYQDQLKYQQTIRYSTSDHISKDLVENLSNQWNWALGHNLNQDDYSQYIYSTYENYITGQSQQKLSAKDVNFEIWRRVLSNLVTLYKKKGTEEAIKYVTNIYGLPEALLFIEELVEIAGTNGGELIESLSNIVVPMDGEMYYVDDLGSAHTLDYRIIANTKYLNINISPFDAIEFDFYDWGWENHPDIVNVNGDVVSISSSTEITQYEFFRRIIRNTIKSDGSARYDSNYPLLEREGYIYYSGSVNQMTLSSLEPYMDFLDDNWAVLITDLVPSSSRLLSVGTLYKNPMWRREKYQWNDSELDPTELPFNEEFEINLPTLTGAVMQTSTGTIEVPEPTGAFTPTPFDSIDPVTTTAAKGLSTGDTIAPEIGSAWLTQTLFGQIGIQDPEAEYWDAPEDIEDLDFIYSSTTYEVDSPGLEPISGQCGTLDYIEYSTNALVVTNENTFDIVFSASNLSDSGYTGLEFDVYKKLYDDASIIDDTKEYSIMSVEIESETYGTYRVSSVENIDLYDFIQVNSDHLPFINQIVQITFIDSGTSIVRTSPGIGLFNLPSGIDNNVIDWFDFLYSGIIDRLSLFLNTLSVPIQDLIDVIVAIVTYIDGGDLSDFAAMIQAIGQIDIQNPQEMFEWFTNQEPGILYGALLLLEYVKSSDIWTIDSNSIALINAVAMNQAKAKFNRIINFFNWRLPEQKVRYANYPGTGLTGDWPFLPTDVPNRGDDNDYNMTGTVTLGGLNYLNAEILEDKSEYFYRFRALTHAPYSWGRIHGLPYFISSGGSILESGYDLDYLNDIKYYGRYFMYMSTPRAPISNIDGIIDGVTPEAAVLAKWHGVGDSDRLELQYLPVDSATVPFTGYNVIESEHWITSATTIAVEALDNVGDDYIYTIQTTLDADTYYWWRVKNFRSKLNMFGHNLEYFTSTEPEVFLTGSFSGGGPGEGEIPDDPTPPKPGDPAYPQEG